MKQTMKCVVLSVTIYKVPPIGKVIK